MLSSLALLALLGAPFDLTTEFEAGAGGAFAQVGAPAVWARVGERIGILTISLHGLSVLGPQGAWIRDRLPTDPTTGFQAWSIVGEARLTVEDLFFVSAGVGAGKVVNWNCTCTESYPATSSVAPSAIFSFGGHISFGDHVFLSPQVGAIVWSGVNQPPGLGTDALKDALLTGFYAGVGIALSL